MANTLEAYTKTSTAVSLPRQQSQSRADSRTAAGLSAFAFQGTNAHAILSASEPTGFQLTELMSMAFSRRRLWFSSVSPHRLLQNAAFSSGRLKILLPLLIVLKVFNAHTRIYSKYLYSLCVKQQDSFCKV